MANPVCLNDCDADLPVVSFDKCNPEIHLSEIRRIFVAKLTAASFTNVALAAEWVTRLSETSVANDDVIRPMTVIADKPAPTPTVKEISGGRKITINKNHIVNITIDETSAINHDMVRALECGGEFKIWYETAGGLLFGGNDGIECSISLDMVLARGDEHMVYNGTCEWKSKFTEEYVISPIAA